MILLSIPKITSGIQIVHLELRLRVLCSVEEVVTAARSPWQNPYAERMIGSIRRECLDHLIVLNERQLRRILSEYIAYYNKVRPHQSLDGNPPEPREVEPPATGKILAVTNTAWQRRKGRRSYFQRPSSNLAPQVRFELTTLRLTAGCSAIELLRNKRP